MKAIGGYLELELRRAREYHPDAIKLNTGRNAFEYILLAKQYNKVFLPYYICDALIEIIHRLKLKCEFYHVDEKLLPKFDFSGIDKKAVFVYCNYFGLCDKQAAQIFGNCKNLIMDNSQSFFSKPLPNTDTFYSPRKFFGVPDGAYLYTDKQLSIKLETDFSHLRFNHLIKRIDIDAETGYTDFINNESSLINQPIKHMSKLTHRMLCSLDYTRIARQRKANFKYLHLKLNLTNDLKLHFDSKIVPMVYPYMVRNGNILKRTLISRKIFVATYWPNVLKYCKKGSFEYELADNTIFLPIDQRYGLKEMASIYDKICDAES